MKALPGTNNTNSTNNTSGASAVVEHQCIGDWVRTNSFGDGERGVGPVSSRSECIDKVRTECEGFDLANMAVDEGQTGCWCQKSEGHEVESRTDDSSSYQTCRVQPLPNYNNETCLGEWVNTNYFGQFGEINIGPVDSRAECIAKAKSECGAEYDLAQIGNRGYGGCYCQKSNGEQVDATKLQESASYETCRVKPLLAVDPAPVQPNTQFHDGCLSNWIKTNHFGVGE